MHMHVYVIVVIVIREFRAKLGYIVAVGNAQLATSLDAAKKRVRRDI